MVSEKPDITVIVATYNPSWNKLERTLKSVLFQDNITVEIIIADDGSRDNCFNEIKALFAKYHFEHYTLLPSETNRGTCRNFAGGVEAAAGEYVKLLSPGDYLYDETTLEKWYRYVAQNHMDMCFGNAVYYDANASDISIVATKNNPANMSVYLGRQKQAHIRENYLLLNDLALGASFLIKTERMQAYIKLIVDQVIYAEDNVIRLMIADGVSLFHFPEIIIWYEYGGGISTSSVKIWQERLTQDLLAANRVIGERIKKNSWFNIRYRLCLAGNPRRARIYKFFLFPRLFFWKFQKTFQYRLTPTNADTGFYRRISTHGANVLEREDDGTCR